MDVVFGDEKAESEDEDEGRRDLWRMLRDQPDDDVASDVESLSSVEVGEVDDSDDETFDPSRPDLLGKRRMPQLSAAGKRLRLSKRERPPQVAETGKLYALPTSSGALSAAASARDCEDRVLDRLVDRKS